MAKRLEIYKCEVCGNVVEVLIGGKGQLVCCEQPMKLMTEQNEESYGEKHVPVLERDGKIWRVKVGSVAHPMEEKHYIALIEVIAGDHLERRYLQPGEVPQAEFELSADEVVAREYCNLHGLWRS
ncbi:MAG TPA: desulfoferrodoxin [Firmicutes bacterium]|nr:desulfoferrodoxin [Bacillota bacterium]